MWNLDVTIGRLKYHYPLRDGLIIKQDGQTLACANGWLQTQNDAVTRSPPNTWSGWPSQEFALTLSHASAVKGKAKPILGDMVMYLLMGIFRAAVSVPECQSAKF
jgi:hypothetical protein